jgi:DNA-binding NarL/FixJ family response regulator
MKLGIISQRILIRRALCTFLASTESALVVMEGNRLSECLDEVKQSRADMLIVDVCEQGLESLPDLRSLGVAAKVVVLMDDPDRASRARAFQLGIWGCLSTSQNPVVFREILRSVAQGKRWMPQEVADEVINAFAEMGGRSHEAHEDLTPREWEVLGFLANGFRNKEIAARLSICEETAKSHVKSIYRKLKIQDRRDAIFRYFESLHRTVDNEVIKDVSPAGSSSSARSNKR